MVRTMVGDLRTGEKWYRIEANAGNGAIQLVVLMGMVYREKYVKYLN